jgi:para-nitrobenzyl esterase
MSRWVQIPAHDEERCCAHEGEVRIVKIYAAVLPLFLLTPSFSQSALPIRSAAAETVRVDGGLLRGTVEDGLRVYRGIPYAAPPVGDLRWRLPQPAPKWEGVLAADQFGRACMQTNQAIANLPAPSEDCLYLNVGLPPRA